MLTRRDPAPTPTKTVSRRALLLQGETPLVPSAKLLDRSGSFHLAKLRNVDVVVKFEDGSEIVLLAQARHPLRAVMAVISAAERTLTAEQLLGIKEITFR